MHDSAFDHVAGSPAFSDALETVRVLVDRGHIAYFAGGCVRDALLGLIPKDYDVATDASPDQVRTYFRRAQGVGHAFGVMLVRMPSSHVEVATFRTDGEYTDGRRPDSVTFATDAEDAKRRDFTINGMFFDPITRSLVDHVGGLHDLRSRTLRAIGDPSQRFDEDYLRILRAIRFAARFNLTIEPATARSIVSHSDHLMRIAPERIGDELRRMLTGARSLDAIRRLDALGVMNVLMRRHDAIASSLTPDSLPLRSDRLIERWTGEYDFAAALASIVADRLLQLGFTPLELCQPSTVRQIDAAYRETIRYSNDEAAAVRETLAMNTLLSAAQPPAVAALKRFLAKPRSLQTRQLLRAIASAGVPTPNLDAIDARISTFAPHEIAPPPWVTGDILTSMGFKPSRHFKTVLDAVYDAQLEGRVRSADEARELARGQMQQASEA